MATIDDIGTPGSPLDTPPLTEWQAAVRDAIHSIVGDGGIPVGSIVAFGSATPPPGWALCDGSAHGSSELEAVIGSPNTPALQNRFIMAAGGAYALGSTGGSDNHVHGLESGFAHIQAASTPAALTFRRPASPAWTATHKVTTTTGAGSDATQSSLATSLFGDTGLASTLPSYYALTYIIKKGQT